MTRRNTMTLARAALLALTPVLLLVAGCVTGGKDGKDGHTGATGRTGATGDTGATGEDGESRTVIVR